MANFDRYEPTDQPGQAFDGGEHDDDRDGSASRLPLLLVLGLLVVAAFAGVVWLAYTQGVQRGASSTQPSQSAAAQPPVAGLKIYEQRAPLDETPSTAAASAPKPPTAIAEPKPAPSAAEPRVLPDKPAAPVKSEQSAEAAPTPKIAAGPVVVPPTPSPAPQPVAGMPSVGQSAPSPATAPAQASAAPASAPTAKATTGGKFLLQIGAFKSEADAKAAWSAFRLKHAAVAGYASDIHRVDLGAKGIWYRVRLGKFETRDAATAFCSKLKADGGACFLAR